MRLAEAVGTRVALGLFGTFAKSAAWWGVPMRRLGGCVELQRR